MPPTENPQTVDPTTNEAVKGLLERVGALSTSVKTVAEEMAELKKQGIILDEVKTAVQEFEKLRAQMEQMQNAIKARKNGLWFPGVEDVGRKFNLLRLCAGIKMRNPEKYAPYEMEVCKEAKNAAERSGHPMTRESTGHVMWDDQSGGFWVPDQAIADVIGPIYTRSIFVALDPSTGQTRCSVLDGLVGNPVKIPEFEGGMIAYWIGEEDDYVTSKTKSGNLELRPRKLGVLTRITEEMMKFASPAFDAFLKRDMIRAAAKKIDYTVVYGTGNENMPRGIKNNPRVKKFYGQENDTSAPSSPTADGVSWNFDNLMEQMGVCEDDNITPDDTWWTMSSPRFFRLLKQLKITNFSGQTAGQPYLLGAPYISDERLRGIIGNFDKTTQIPTTNPDVAGNGAKCTDVIQGNLGEVLIGRWGGVQILDDGGTGTGFISDQTYVKLRMFMDVEVRQAKALTVGVDAKVR